MNMSQKPPKFRGRTGENIDVFINKMLGYFAWVDAANTAAAKKVLTESEKAYIICQCMDEKAAEWVSAALSLNPVDMIGTGKQWSSFAEFLAHIRSSHKKYYDPVEDAQNKILNIRQGDSILSYNQEFLTLKAKLDKTKWPEDPLLALYKKGLSKWMYTSLAGQAGSAGWNLDTWMQNAKTMERGAYTVKARERTFTPHWDRPRVREPDVVPMDIDKRTFRRSHKGRTRKRSNTSNNSKCYKCGKLGHFAKNCRVQPRKNQGKPPRGSRKWKHKRRLLEEVSEASEDSNEEEEVSSEEEEKDFPKRT